MVLVAKRKRVPSAFGQRLRELREEAGITLAELGQRAGMHFTAVSRIERGVVEPNWPTVVKLAAALDADLNKFKD